MRQMIAEPGLRCSERRHTIQTGRLCLSGISEEAPADVSRSDFRNHCTGCPQRWAQGKGACCARFPVSWQKCWEDAAQPALRPLRTAYRGRREGRRGCLLRMTGRHRRTDAQTPALPVLSATAAHSGWIGRSRTAPTLLSSNRVIAIALRTDSLVSVAMRTFALAQRVSRVLGAMRSMDDGACVPAIRLAWPRVIARAVVAADRGISSMICSTAVGVVASDP